MEKEHVTYGFVINVILLIPKVIKKSPNDYQCIFPNRVLILEVLVMGTLKMKILRNNLPGVVFSVTRRMNPTMTKQMTPTTALSHLDPLLPKTRLECLPHAHVA
eukprot:Lithocolla_globosa_v1_NODE_2988_length_1804_cov_3.187536.p3 type:complete len:104 gc:universal NODE_2988_length_1804_cov_3.187536:1361-1050(-)